MKIDQKSAIFVTVVATWQEIVSPDRRPRGPTFLLLQNNAIRHSSRTYHSDLHAYRPISTNLYIYQPAYLPFSRPKTYKLAAI
jgi:hypothetical protein